MSKYLADCKLILIPHDSGQVVGWLSVPRWAELSVMWNGATELTISASLKRSTLQGYL